MKYLAAFALVLVATICPARDLAPSKDKQLASTLGLIEELTPSGQDGSQPYIVRIFAAPVSVSECGGPVSTCPNVDLYITVSTGDLEDPPSLYQLPPSKGWTFVKWNKPSNVGQVAMASFVLRTTLPEANVSPEARKAWHPHEYTVQVSPSSASYTER